MKARKKSSRDYLQTRRNGETGTARVLPKLQEIFNTVVNQCDRVHERLAVCDYSALSK